MSHPDGPCDEVTCGMYPDCAGNLPAMQKLAQRKLDAIANGTIDSCCVPTPAEHAQLKQEAEHDWYPATLEAGVYICARTGARGRRLLRSGPKGKAGQIVAYSTPQLKADREVGDRKAATVKTDIKRLGIGTSFERTLSDFNGKE